MLCCLGQWKDPFSAYHDQTGNGGVSLFPGQRRHLSRGGINDPLMVNVVIPDGMQAGQTLQIAAPDGSRTVTATIPPGMSPGQSFFVTFPTAAAVGSVGGAGAGNGSTSGSHGNSSGNGNGNGSNFSGNGAGPLPTPIAAPALPPVANPLKTALADLSSTPFSQALDSPAPTNISRMADPLATHSSSNNNNNSNNNSNTNQKLLLVTVPPGSAPGSTLYVQVPGENRTLAAKVPPGVSQFHVAYQPRASTEASPSPTSNNYNYNHNNNTNTMQHAVTTNPVPTSIHNDNSSNNSQKLILVRVPPGTVPGSILHVEVPDEPGRILAAQVPPNVSEFQVAYVPRQANNHSNNAMPIINNPNGRPLLLTQHHHHAPMSSGYHDIRPSYSNNNLGGPMNPYNVSSNSNGRMGSTMVPLIGGAALGAAGVAMYDHYHHAAGYYPQDYGDGGGYDGYGGYDDVGGGGCVYDDYGGADFGDYSGY